MVCNTAHAFYEGVQKAVDVPLLHLIRISVGALISKYGLEEGDSIGVLATSGTLETGLYHEALQQRNLIPVSPQLHGMVQTGVMEAIYSSEFGVKGINRPTEESLLRIKQAVEDLEERGAKIVIAGCTELPLLLSELEQRGDLKIPWVNPLRIMAETVWDLSYHQGAFAALSALEAGVAAGKLHESIIELSEGEFDFEQLTLPPAYRSPDTSAETPMP